MASLNITSLPAHIDELRIWSQCQNIDLLAINETRLDTTIQSSLVSLEGYDLLRCDRNRHGGGVCVYVRQGINYLNRVDLVNSEIEALCVEIKKPNCKAFIVLACYRPPNSNVDNFFTIYENILKHLDNEKKEVYVLGDLNCNLLSNSSDSYATRLLKSTSELYQFTQLITEATRVTNQSRTLIDLFYTNAPNRVVNSGVCHIGLSDHSLIYATRKIAIPSKAKQRFVTSRSFKNFDNDKFCDDLNSLEWDTLKDMSNPNQMWETWKDMFLSVADRLAPMKTKRLRHKRSPWLTSDIRKQMNRRNYLKSLAVKTNNDEDWRNYKSITNEINRAIRKAKALHYKSQINNHSNNPKEIWKIINEVSSRSKNTNINISSVKTELGNTITEAKELSEAFNTHFVEIGPKLASKIPQGSSSFSDYIDKAKTTFTLQRTTPDEIIEIVKSMSSNKATGLDNISCRLLKVAAPIVSKSLAFVFNKSIETGIFPTDLKFAKVTPIFKANEKDNLNNYRPISVLPAVAKIFERITYNQLYAYLNGHKLLSNFQSGFRPLHSTATALLEATSNWLSNMDSGLLNSVTFLDFSKAFDTVNHGTLLEKMSFYGICDKSIQWFNSYLTDRQQKCYVNDVLSTAKHLECGVPQGSILGPLLFLIYINDLPNCIQYSTPRMYADDTSLTTVGSSLNGIAQQLNLDLENIRIWLIANKLSLNVTKTEQMFVGSDDNLKKINKFNFNINIDGQPIDRVTSSKTLGVKLDERLCWSVHTDYVCKKVSSAISGLRQIRDFIPQETAITVYNGLILPWFDYCDVVWDNLPSTSAERLQKLQNRAARVITRQNYDIRSHNIRKTLKWETLEERRFKHKATMMYKTQNNSAPTCLQNLFREKDNSVYNLRNNNNQLVLGIPRTEYLKRAFVYNGARIWNQLPEYIKQAKSLSSFKRELSSVNGPYH